jgi:hypothetical protein
MDNARLPLVLTHCNVKPDRKRASRFSPLAPLFGFLTVEVEMELRVCKTCLVQVGTEEIVTLRYLRVCSVTRTRSGQTIQHGTILCGGNGLRL